MFPPECTWQTVCRCGASDGLARQGALPALAQQDSSLLLGSQGAKYSVLYYHAFTEYLVLTYCLLNNKIMVCSTCNRV